MAAFPLEKRLSKWPDRWTRPRRFRRFDRKKCSVVDIFLRGKVTENSASTTTTIKMAELITRLSGNLSLHHVGKRKKKRGRHELYTGDIKYQWSNSENESCPSDSKVD